MQIDLTKIEESIHNTIKTYNFLAKSYADEWSSKPDLELAEFFLAQLNTGDKILDIGCGPGQYSKFFHERGFEVTGIDLSDAMLEQARAMHIPIIFQKMDMRDLRFVDQSFDALWVCSSSPHLHSTQMPQALAEWKRVTKKGGVLFINAIIGDLPYRLESPIEIDQNSKTPGRFFQWYPDIENFEKIIKESGFSIFHIISKEIYSTVVKNARHRTNYWVNFFCRTVD